MAEYNFYRTSWANGGGFGEIWANDVDNKVTRAYYKNDTDSPAVLFVTLLDGTVMQWPLDPHTERTYTPTGNAPDLDDTLNVGFAWPGLATFAKSKP